MSLRDIKDKLLGKSDREISIERVSSNIEKKGKEGLKIADYYSTLASCKNTFLQTINSERINALKRREKHIGDAPQKARIHDAAVGLLAIEEAEIELESAARAGDFQAAQKKLGFVISQIGRLDPSVAISKKDLKEKTGFSFDDTNETEAFVERADLVDEEFVENLIQGFTMDECLAKKLNAGASAPAAGKIDFTSGNQEADEEFINGILKKNADKR